MAPGKYFDRNEAAAYLQSCGVRYTRGTLNTYAHAGKGPAYRIVGNGRGKAIYSMRDLDAFIKSMTQPCNIKRDMKNEAAK